MFALDRRGRVSTVAVLPPALVPVGPDLAQAFGLDPCVVGHDVALESVPTDVEIGRHGRLVVSVLPGGPEDGSLGANGAGLDPAAHRPPAPEASVVDRHHRACVRTVPAPSPERRPVVRSTR